METGGGNKVHVRELHDHAQLFVGYERAVDHVSLLADHCICGS